MSDTEPIVPQPRPETPAELPEPDFESEFMTPPEPIPASAPAPVKAPENRPPASAPMSEVTRATPVTAVAAAPQPFGAGRCPRCGGTNFGKGALLTYGTNFRPAYYKPARLSLFRLRNMFRPFARLIEVEAQACRSCGLVLFQIDPKKLARVDKDPGSKP